MEYGPTLDGAFIRAQPRRDVGGKALDEEVLLVPMRVRDDELRRPALPCAIDGGECFGGHELAESCVLESRRPELLGRDDAADPFHVHGDEDPGRALRLYGREANDGEETAEGQDQKMAHGYADTGGGRT